MERALIAEFEQLIDELLPALREDRMRDATLLVELYMKIRGYGPVKEKSVAEVRLAVAQGLRTLISVSSEAA
jgi:indolepyruvate ferredoxin oxidoreductase